jgi:hypothetical protein
MAGWCDWRNVQDTGVSVVEDGFMVDIERASEFMRTHARLLDRRRFELLVGDGSAAAALAALSGYRNADGGFGSGLEPDLRSDSSQPGGALHAFEVFEEIGPETSPMAVELCDWLGSVSLPGGALPFAFAVPDPAGSATFWVEADSAAPSLFITSAVCGVAHRVAEHDPAVAGHPWLEAATDWCMAQVAALAEAPFAIAFRYVLQFLDAVHGKREEAAAELARLGELLPESATLPVPGGAEGERLTPLDISPWPGRPLRDLLSPEAVAADLDRLASEQRADGGWDVDFNAFSPVAALEWRGYTTVWALTVLLANGRLRIG